jgi:hypothetical protein
MKHAGLIDSGPFKCQLPVALSGSTKPLGADLWSRIANEGSALGEAYL